MRHLACISLAPMALTKPSSEWRGMWRVCYYWQCSFKSSIECQMQIAALGAEAAQLKEESQSLQQQTSLTRPDVTDKNKTLGVLMDTNVALTVKKRQARKLSKQPQVAEHDVFQGKS